MTLESISAPRLTPKSLSAHRGEPTDAPERAHLVTIAADDESQPVEDVESLAPEAADVPNLVEPNPAYVTGSSWNDAVADLFPGAVDGPNPNLARWNFTDPVARDVLPDWSSVAQSVLARLRTNAGKHPGSPRFQRIEDELRAASPEADGRWPRYDIATSQAGAKPAGSRHRHCHGRGPGRRPRRSDHGTQPHAYCGHGGGMVKVALVYPEVYDMARFKEHRKEFPPFGVLYLAAVLEEAGHRVVIERVWPGRTALDLTGYGAVGFSLSSSATYGLMRQARRTSRIDPGALNMVGGVHCNFYPAQSLTDFTAHVAADGEAEQTILDILDHAQDRDFSAVPGVLYPDHGPWSTRA